MPNNTSKRFYGEVGYAPTVVDDYGVATVDVIKRNYHGNVITLNSKWQPNGNVNDDIRVSHQISILADPYAIENFPYIKYVEWLGIKWEVVNSKVEFPRIILSLGGVYNGDQTRSSC